MTKKEWKTLDNLIEKGSKEDKSWRCEICGRSKEQGYQIHHHHYKGRIHTALRWVNENIFVVCYVCHKRFENDPVWAKKTAEDMRGTKWAKLIEKLTYLTNKKTFEENRDLIFKSLEEVYKSYGQRLGKTNKQAE